MNATNGSENQKPKVSPYGKVMGIVKSTQQFRTIADALVKLGVHDVTELTGRGGLELLDREEDTVSDYVLGDMEPKMVQLYHDAVKNGDVVFVASVNPDSADRIAEVAKAQGALQVVHFGEWVITNY